MVEEYNPVEIRQEGSYISGLVGALLGALVGAVVWCLVMQLEIISSLVGFVIGWLAEKGYTLLRGKVGLGKVAILVISVIFGVLVGTFAGHYVIWCKEIAEYAPVPYGEVPFMILETLQSDSDYLISTIKDVGLGLLFAFMGVFGLLKATKQQTSK